MPSYYCDYCDAYLAHNSPSVRRQHNAGSKHKSHVRAYYQKILDEQTKLAVDMKIKQHVDQVVINQQNSALHNQELATSFSLGQPNFPMVLPPNMPYPSRVPHPVFPMLIHGAPAYGAPLLTSTPHATPSMPMPMQFNGPPPIVSGTPSFIAAQGTYIFNPAPNATAENFTYLGSKK